MPDEDKTEVTLADVLKPVDDAAAPAAEAPATTETPPSKYAGKSADELAKMLEDAQSMIGRQSAEIGEVRRLADGLIQAQLKTGGTTTQEVSEPEDVTITADVLEDPDKTADAIQRLIDRKVAEQLRPVNDRVGQLSTANLLKRLDDDHPSWRETTQSKEYTEWVKASPVRQRLAREGNEGNYDSGHELLSMWEALHPTAPADAATNTDPNADALKAATPGEPVDVTPFMIR